MSPSSRKKLSQAVKKSWAKRKATKAGLALEFVEVPNGESVDEAIAVSPLASIPFKYHYPADGIANAVARMELAATKYLAELDSIVSDVRYALRGVR